MISFFHLESQAQAFSSKTLTKKAAPRMYAIKNYFKRNVNKNHAHES